MIIHNNIAILEDDLISSWVKETGRLDHDQNMLPLILDHIKETDIIIDIGAFIGDHTIAYAKKANFVYAFEPNIKAFECLEYNMKPFDNVHCHNIAIGQNGKGSFINSKGNEGAAYVDKSKDGSIKIKSLVDFFTVDVPIDFIKIDVEGMELDVLIGSEEIIKKYHPKILIEINKGALARNGSSEIKIFDFLNQNGYIWKNIYPNEPISGDQYDIICEAK